MRHWKGELEVEERTVGLGDGFAPPPPVRSMCDVSSCIAHP